MANIYITREELRNKPYDLLEEDVDNDYLEVLQDMTKEYIDELCGQSFLQEGTPEAPVEKILSGTGKDTIFLPRRLLSLTKVKIYSQVGGFQEYDGSNFLTDLKWVSFKQFADETARFVLIYGGILFPQGVGNIGIVGVWGWAALPNPIKYLQGKLIKKMVEDETFAERFSSESIGDYSRNLNIGSTEVGGKFLIGDRELDLIVRQYKAWVLYGVA